MKNRDLKGGVTSINKIIRESAEYKLWRKSVFERDNFTCIWCFQKGGNLNADHIKPFALFPELRFAIDNGRTKNIMYHRKNAEKELMEKFGFKSTGEKHEENYFTWWFQNYYLFEKFGIDKRKAHLSSLIVSGQMTREEALKIVNKNPVYPELGIEKRVMKYPKREHSEFPMDKWYGRISKLVKICKS